jgi:hypothetical protein
MVKKQTPIIKYNYNCYKCVKDNHGTPLFETNSKTDYENHWLGHNIRTTCYPNKADCDIHGWTPQGKDWEL